MVKLNNRGVTLTELLVSLAILAVFMTSVTYFITSMSKGTSKAKKQVQVQQDAQDIYEDLSQMIMQAKCIVIKTDEIIAKGAVPSADASAVASSNPSADGIDYKKAFTADQDGLTQGGEFDKGYLIPESAARCMWGAINKYNYLTDPDALDNFEAAADTDYVIGAAGRFRVKKNNSTNKWEITNKVNTISTAQYEIYRMCLGSKFGTNKISTFQNNEYSVEGLYLGPITVKEGATRYTRYNTLVYDGNRIYLNRNTTGPDFSTNEANVIAENCYQFSVIPTTGKSNSLYLKLMLLSGGAEGTVDASYSADANTVTKKTAVRNGDTNYLVSKAGYTYTLGGTVNIRNANVLN